MATSAATRKQLPAGNESSYSLLNILDVATIDIQLLPEEEESAAVESLVISTNTVNGPLLRVIVFESQDDVDDS